MSFFFSYIFRSFLLLRTGRPLPPSLPGGGASSSPSILCERVLFIYINSVRKPYPNNRCFNGIFSIRTVLLKRDDFFLPCLFPPRLVSYIRNPKYDISVMLAAAAVLVGGTSLRSTNIDVVPSPGVRDPSTVFRTCRSSRCSPFGSSYPRGSIR